MVCVEVYKVKSNLAGGLHVKGSKECSHGGRREAHLHAGQRLFEALGPNRTDPVEVITGEGRLQRIRRLNIAA